MPDFGDGASVDQVAQEAMPVGGHGNEIAVGLGDGLQNLVGWTAQGKLNGHAQALRTQAGRRPFQRLSIRLHLFRLRQLQLLKVTRRPTIGHMQQQHIGLKVRRQLTDVSQEVCILFRQVKRHQDPAIHGLKSLTGLGSWHFRLFGLSSDCFDTTGAEAWMFGMNANSGFHVPAAFAFDSARRDGQLNLNRKGIADNAFHR